MQISILSLILSLFAQPAFATETGLSYTQYAQTKTNVLSASGEFGSKTVSDKDPSYDWNTSYSNSISEVTSATNEKVTDTTNDFQVGVGFNHSSGFSGGLNLDYSRIPEEELTNIGPTFTLGYKYKFDSTNTSTKPEKKIQSSDEPEVAEESDEDGFTPGIGLDISYGSVNYIQKFTAQRREKGSVKPVTGNETITQKFAGISLNINPREWVSLQLRYKKYTYSKDVNKFLQFLDARSPVTLGISQVLSGFIDNENSIELDFYITENWDLDFDHTIYRLQSDGSQSTSDSAQLNYTYKLTTDWKLGLGVSNTKASSASTGISSQTSGTGKVSFQF